MRYLDHIAKIDISHTAPHLQMKRYNNLLYLRSVDEDKQAPPLQQRPGDQDAKKALVDMHKQVRQDCGVTFIPKVERHCLRNQLDPSMQKYLEWLSTNWAEDFAEERPSRHPLLPGHQVHPFGPRPPGLRTGINTNGKTVRGLKSGKMKQHRLRSQEVDPGTGKLGAQFRTPSRKLSTSTHDRRLNNFCVTDFNNGDALVVDL